MCIGNGEHMHQTNTQTTEIATHVDGLPVERLMAAMDAFMTADFAEEIAAEIANHDMPLQRAA